MTERNGRRWKALEDYDVLPQAIRDKVFLMNNWIVMTNFDALRNALGIPTGKGEKSQTDEPTYDKLRKNYQYSLISLPHPSPPPTL